MPTKSFHVSAASHDFLAYKDLFNNWQFKLNNDYVAFGYKSIGQKNQCSGFYFENVTVPTGSIIRAAYLVFRSTVTRNQAPARGFFAIEDTATPLPFSTLANWQARTYNIVTKAWNYEKFNWNTGDLYASPDLSELVQNIIDLPAWLSGNPLSLFWGDLYGVTAEENNWDREAESFISNPSQSVRLEITYTPPTPAEPPEPPDPPTPPPPPRKGWAALNLYYEYLDDGYKLVLYTDVPCHCYCRMTTTPPRKHADRKSVV